MRVSNQLANQLKETSIEPKLIFQIDGISTLFGSDTIKRVPRYGDNLFYGDPGLYYGGLVDVEDQQTLISLEGTTTSIKQNLAPDKARGSGITSLSIVLIDKNLEATKIAAGTYGDILFRKCKVWVGFGDASAFSDDYILLFRGIIESFQAGQGKVKFNLSSPDQKRRSLILPKGDTALNGAIGPSDTTITLDSVENFFVVPDHPAYAPKDDDLLSYVKIEDEYIKYTGISGNQLTGCVRGQFFTTPASHADGVQAETFFKVEGNAMELALKLMLSDPDQTPYISGLDASTVNLPPGDPVANSFYFGGTDFEREYNVRIGDYVKSSGFTNGANNLSNWTEILDVVKLDGGYLIVVDATLVDEAPATGSVDFLSRYNSLGEFGLFMDTDEVDIQKHDYLRRNFLLSQDYRFYIREEIEDAKEWLETEIYRPASCYSLPADRGGLARLSVGLHIAPLPNESILEISRKNVVKPNNIEVKRSVNKNYYNAVLFRFEDTPEDEKFRRKSFTVPGTQLLQDTRTKALVIDSGGLKADISGPTLATQAGNRLLRRYQSAAEYVDGLEILFSVSVQINVGDIIILDPTGLNMIYPAGEDRNRPPGLWEVVNKDINIKGQAKIDLVNTAFNIDARYGLFSAASKVKTVLAQNKIVIEGLSAFPKFGSSSEYRKWDSIDDIAVKIRDATFSNVHETIIQNVSFNTITLRDNAPFTLVPGMIMELCNYSFSDITAQQKLIYAYWTDGTNNFPDGENPYVFI